jgi:hypothetical protein
MGDLEKNLRLNAVNSEAAVGSPRRSTAFAR